MRRLLGLVLVIAVLFAIGGDWYRSRMSQKHHVNLLIDLARATEKARHCNWTKVCVFYDQDLEWLEDEGRYVQVWPIQEPTADYAWLAGNDWLNLLESPRAILIICNDYGESALADEIIAEIKELSSVEQIWLVDVADENNVTAHGDIAKLFPNLIIESPWSYNQVPF